MSIVRHSAAALVLALSGLSAPALGCKPLFLESQQKLALNSIAVLAYPIAISTIPENALTPAFQAEFRQTIQWQILVSWKGVLRPGDVITTITEHEPSNCGTGAMYDREAMLLFLDGKEPFTTPIIERPIQSIRDLKYLDGIIRGN